MLSARRSLLLPLATALTTLAIPSASSARLLETRTAVQEVASHDRTGVHRGLSLGSYWRNLDLGAEVALGSSKFLQTDPAGFIDGPNLYTAFGNDPVNMGDPSGLWPRDVAAFAEGRRAAMAAGIDEAVWLAGEQRADRLIAPLVGAGLAAMTGAGLLLYGGELFAAGSLGWGAFVAGSGAFMLSGVPAGAAAGVAGLATGDERLSYAADLTLGLTSSPFKLPAVVTASPLIDDVGDVGTVVAVTGGVEVVVGVGIGVSRSLALRSGGRPPSGVWGALESPGPVEDLLYGARVREGLPGCAGVTIPRRPTIVELENLTAKHGVEFAVTYEFGPGAAGGGGQYFLHSGTSRDVDVPVSATRMLIYHTHPRGVAIASPADYRVLEAAELAGSPQRSSVIIPVGRGRTVRYGLGRR